MDGRASVCVFTRDDATYRIDLQIAPEGVGSVGKVFTITRSEECDQLWISIGVEYSISVGVNNRTFERTWRPDSEGQELRAEVTDGEIDCHVIQYK